ncbi:hypothetical protein [Nostoc sp.]|uniref:hypothetical protein n=1 Tax=Nostoc sp. TaxID=1180 RepID=UPI002FFC781C
MVYTTDLLAFGNTILQPPEEYFSYDPSNGALYYGERQLAQLPSGLNPNEVISDLD